MKINLIIILGVINISTTVAYVDPGTAGLIVGGGIWPYIVAAFTLICGFLVKYFFGPIKRVILKRWR